MARDKKIQIQVYDEEKEWQDYFAPHAEINKTSGREYFAARTDVTANTFNFDILYHEKIEDIVFNTSRYRIIYKGYIWDIQTADNYKLRNINLIIVANSTSQRI